MPQGIEVTPLTPPEAVDMIVNAEVTSRRFYEARLAHPTWPGGESGVTIGVGYDLGFADDDQFARDWSMLRQEALRALATACGVKGVPAKALADKLSMHVVPWDAAYSVFRDRSLPKYERMALQAFPGSFELPPLCFGALVSLAYNRGVGMTDKQGDPLQSRREMRAIRDLVDAGKLAEVPEQIRSMKRLWKGKGLDGLLTRRDAEAAMWERGLAALA